MLKVKTFTFNPFQENTYIIHNDNKEAIIIDPGMYEEAENKIFFDFIQNNQLTIKYIVNTHCHLDHIFGVEACLEKFDLPFFYHQNEQTVLDWAEQSAMMYGVKLNKPSSATSYISEKDSLTLGDEILELFFTPGHSPGSISIYSESNNFLIAGDVIFKQSVGRTDLPGGDTQTLLNSITKVVYALPNEVVIYSGHGPETTVGLEKMNNPFVRG